MLLNIGEYRITDDHLNFTIHKVGVVPERNKKDEVNKYAGSERLTVVGHFGSLRDAMMRIVIEDLHSDDITSVSEVVAAIDLSTARIIMALEG